MKKRLGRAILSMLLILAAVASLVIWETQGRERVMTTHVLAAAGDIQEGQLIETQMLCSVSVLKENALAGSLKPRDASMVAGKRADCHIEKNQQITVELLQDENYSLIGQHAPCVIPGEMILTMSSSIRKGDTVSIYDSQGERHLGEYKVAFAKDASNQEIIDPEKPGARKKILQRTNSNAVLDHLEIEAEIQAYAAILKEATSGGGILIIQKGD